MTKRLLACLIGLLVFGAHPAWAAPLVLGDFTGVTVEFLNVVTDDGVLVGPATQNGDSLEFSPRLSSGAAGGSAATTIATLTYSMSALPGFAIEQFGASESGFFSLTGTGGLDTTVGATFSFEFTVDEVDGNPIAPLTDDITPSNLFNLEANPGNDQPWSMGVFANLPGFLTANSVPFSFGVTHAFFTITNTLSATSEGGSAALMSKDILAITASTIPITSVPEPSSLFLVGLGAMTAYRRLRRRP